MFLKDSNNFTVDKANTLTTARTINGTSFNGSANITTSNWGTARNLQIGNTAKSVNGSANVTWSLSEIGAAASSHSHNIINTQGDMAPQTGRTATAGLRTYGYYNNGGPTSFGEVISFGNGSGGHAEIAVSWSGTPAVHVRSLRDTTDNWTSWYKIYHSGNKPTPADIGAAASSHTHNYAGSSSAGGNANAAVKLVTARTINGTNFDGSANITTANWGTARNIQIGNTAKSVNGSGNVSWSLSEIGAAPAGYGLGTTCQDKSNQDCNNILVTGFYMGSNMTNKPSGCTQGWIYLLVMRHNDSWVRQVAYDFGTASQVYTRVKQNGSWTSWVATDNNTWRGVQNNLTSTATDQSLSAAQGKILNDKITSLQNELGTNKSTLEANINSIKGVL